MSFGLELPFSSRNSNDPVIQKNVRPKNCLPGARAEENEQPRLLKPPERRPSPNRSAGRSLSPRQVRLRSWETSPPSQSPQYLHVKVSDRLESFRPGTTEGGEQKSRTSRRSNLDLIPRRPANEDRLPSRETTGQPRKTPQSRQPTRYTGVGTQSDPNNVQPSAREEQEDDALPRLSSPPDREAGRRRSSGEYQVPKKDRERSRGSTVFRSASKPSLPPPGRPGQAPNPSTYPRDLSRRRHLLRIDRCLPFSRDFLSKMLCFRLQDESGKREDVY